MQHHSMGCTALHGGDLGFTAQQALDPPVLLRRQAHDGGGDGEADAGAHAGQHHSVEADEPVLLLRRREVDLDLLTEDFPPRRALTQNQHPPVRAPLHHLHDHLSVVRHAVFSLPLRCSVLYPHD